MDSKDGAKDYVALRKGLPDGKSLGELEAQVLDIIWGIEEENPGAPVSTTQVFKIMYPKRELSYSTCMLTMAKMSRKGFLEQTRNGDKKTDAFQYKTNVTRVQMAEDLMDAVAHAVLGKSFRDALNSGTFDK